MNVSVKDAGGACMTFAVTKATSVSEFKQMIEQQQQGSMQDKELEVLYSMKDIKGLEGMEGMGDERAERLRDGNLLLDYDIEDGSIFRIVPSVERNRYEPGYQTWAAQLVALH